MRRNLLTRVAVDGLDLNRVDFRPPRRLLGGELGLRLLAQGGELRSQLTTELGLVATHGVEHGGELGATSDAALGQLLGLAPAAVDLASDGLALAVLGIDLGHLHGGLLPGGMGWDGATNLGRSVRPRQYSTALYSLGQRF